MSQSPTEKKLREIANKIVLENESGHSSCKANMENCELAYAIEQALVSVRNSTLDEALQINCCGEPECIEKLERLKTPEGREG